MVATDTSLIDEEIFAKLVRFTDENLLNLIQLSK